MLILSRKKDEGLIIQAEGIEIEVQIKKIENGVVKIGIQAPESVRIYREEIYTQIKESNQCAIVKQDVAFPDVLKNQKAIFKKLTEDSQEEDNF